MINSKIIEYPIDNEYSGYIAYSNVSRGLSEYLSTDYYNHYKTKDRYHIVVIIFVRTIKI